MTNLDSSLTSFSASVPGLIVLCGPTASGKSSLAIAVAKRLNSVILSADSRQVYQEFNIGTAKPTPTEQAQVPHYLIDICKPTTTLTVADYQDQAQQLLKRGFPTTTGQPGIPLLVGGTGLYIRAITHGLKIPRVPPQPSLRSQFERLGQSFCHQLLSQVDPIAAAKIHANDAVRTVRSLEVFYTTGQPISMQQGENPPAYPILQLGLDCATPAALTARIEHRTRQMLAAGLVAEVETLQHQYGPDLPLLNTLGYAEIRRALAGELSLAIAEEQIVLHTRQFAKRQRTWFRANPAIQWFDAEAPDLLEQVWAVVAEFVGAIAIPVGTAGGVSGGETQIRQSNA